MGRYFPCHGNTLLNDAPKVSMDSQCVAVAPPIGTACPRRIENDQGDRKTEEEVRYELGKHPRKYGRQVGGLIRLRRRYVAITGVRRGNVPVASISHARRGGDRGREVGQQGDCREHLKHWVHRKKKWFVINNNNMVRVSN